MKPDPKKKPRPRPRARNRNGQRRAKYIQVRLSDAEYEIVRRKLGRAAAAIAREHWLGFQTKSSTAPNAESVLPMARALYACQGEIERLHRQVEANQKGGSLLDTLKLLKNHFQHLIRVWSSNSSIAKL